MSASIYSVYMYMYSAYIPKYSVYMLCKNARSVSVPEGCVCVYNREQASDERLQRECCLFALNSVTSTPQWIRLEKARDQASESKDIGVDTLMCVCVCVCVCVCASMTHICALNNTVA